MRLLHIDDEDHISLVEFTGRDIPPYAILSHTWGPDHEEVTFHDMLNGTGLDKVGYEKISFCARQAAKDHLRYFWVDTCCIDKSSSAELTESINSMFGWYRESAVCYVALVDLTARDSVADHLQSYRWFSRGWTLQELIAPNNVIFFNNNWQGIGSKATLASTLIAITRMSYDVLVQGKLAHTSVATKVSWASRRETKRIEDEAYCILGIFDVSMPLIYGEGIKAFRRLQEEIMKRSNDLTLFAWDPPISPRETLITPLASCAAAFANSSDIEGFEDDFAEFSLTNKGLMISGDIPLRTATVTDPIMNYRQTIYAMFLGLSGDRDGGIYLRKIGPNLFCRDGQLALAGFRTLYLQERMFFGSETCILHNTFSAGSAALSYRDNGIHVPFDTKGNFELRHAYPQMLWDVTDRIFLRPKRYFWSEYSMVLVMRFNVTLHGNSALLAILVHHLESGPAVEMFTQDQYPQGYEVICQDRYKREGIHVQELDLQAPGIRGMSNMVAVRAGERCHHISATLVPKQIATFAGIVSVLSLSFTTNLTISPTSDAVRNVETGRPNRSHFPGARDGG